jgi:hypothetical protein
VYPSTLTGGDSIVVHQRFARSGEGEAVSDLGCASGISRKTGHKIFTRYE